MPRNFKFDNDWQLKMRKKIKLNTRLYPQIFPGASIKEVIDLVEQVKGRDIKITHVNGKIEYADEKLRREYYSDIALEYGHDHGPNDWRPGWIEKDLDTDHIIYVRPNEAGTGFDVFDIEWSSLKAAWDENKHVWKQQWGGKSINPGYDTIFCPVPADVLKSAGVKIKEYNL